MNTLFQNILTASFHGSIVILAVMLLRLVLKKTPRKLGKEWRNCGKRNLPQKLPTRICKLNRPA